MEWYEDPIRALDEVRRAHWRGALRVLAYEALLLLIAAILFPVFARAESYSGPGMSPRRIAEGIHLLHDKEGRWATDFDDLRPFLNRIPRRRFTISFIRLTDEPSDVRYAISVNGTLQTFHFPEAGYPEPVGGVPKTVVLNPDRS